MRVQNCLQISFKIARLPILLITTFLFYTLSYSQINTRYRIKNASDHSITEVALFSESFTNLKKGCKSRYKKIFFKKNLDNPMLSFTIDKIRLAIYASPPKESGKYTFVIDSVDLDNRLIHFSKVKD